MNAEKQQHRLTVGILTRSAMNILADVSDQGPELHAALEILNSAMEVIKEGLTAENQERLRRQIKV